MSLKEALRRLESEIDLYVAEWARRRVFVHAGVVAWKGQAIVLPGRSYSGKTTLVAALVRAGATYYSDEHAVLDTKGRVHPYAKPLSLREDVGGGPRRCAAEDLGGLVGSKPVRVGMVTMCEYRDGARWRPRLLSPGRAVLALLAHTVPARRRPNDALAVLKRVVAEARVFSGVRGEAEEMADSVLSLCG